MNNQDIAISINHFRAAGGMESYCFDLVREFQHRGIRPTVYANKFDQQLNEYRYITPVLINQSHIPKKLRPWFFSQQLQRKRGKHQTLLACNSTDNASLLICGGTHIGYLTAMQQRAHVLDKLFIRQNQTSYQTAQHIMAHSHLMKHEIHHLYGIKADKISVVHPPADTKRYFPQFANDTERAAARQQYGFQPEDTLFLFPSTGHKRKGFDLLADYFRQSDLPIKLVVAGSPVTEPIPNVISLGFCRQMPELYSLVDYTIMASLYEPFGLVGVESVLCGTKVILSKNMGCTEVLNEEAGFFFDRQQPHTLDHAIRQAVQLKQTQTHKLASPMQALRYNPTSEHHMDELLKLLNLPSETTS